MMLGDPSGMSAVTDQIGGTDAYINNLVQGTEETNSDLIDTTESGAQFSSNFIPGPSDAVPGAGAVGLYHEVTSGISFFNNLDNTYNQAENTYNGPDSNDPY